MATGTCKSRRRGFTLIEMLVLIIIIAVISSVAVPAYARFYARAGFQRTMQSVVSQLALARDAAIQNGTDTVVRFDFQSGVLEVRVESPPPSTDVPTAMQDSPDALQAVEPRLTPLGEDVVVREFTTFGPAQAGMAADAAATPGGELRFHEDGSSNGARIVIQHAGGYAAGIEVSPATGKVQLIDDITRGMP